MHVSRRDQTVVVELSPGNRITASWDEIVEAAKSDE